MAPPDPLLTRRAALRAGGVLAAAGSLVTVLPSPRGWAAGTVPAGMTRRTLSSGRTYLIRSRTSPTAGPLVIGLHGSYLTAQNCNDTFWVTTSTSTTGWVNHAAAPGRDYTLVLGEALGGSWNVGGGWPSGAQNDDRYLLDVVADVQLRQSNVDRERVFVAGFSVGGAMAWRAAALYPDVFAACGSSSGWATSYPATRIDCWHVHGTADTTVPIRGGTGTLGHVFPAACMEALSTTRDSRCILYPTSGGHGTPSWMADQLWTFWTSSRLRP